MPVRHGTQSLHLEVANNNNNNNTYLGNMNLLSEERKYGEKHTKVQGIEE